MLLLKCACFSPSVVVSTVTNWPRNAILQLFTSNLMVALVNTEISLRLRYPSQNNKRSSDLGVSVKQPLIGKIKGFQKTVSSQMSFLTSSFTFHVSVVACLDSVLALMALASSLH